MYRAAVIGLGNIGFRFNLDPKRKETWSHVSAYERCKDTQLAAAVEINPDNIEAFKKQYPQVPVFSTLREMMQSVSVDIVSICTPTGSHCLVLEELACYPIRAIFCEKPIAASVAEGRRMVELCVSKGIVLCVNYTRRWDENYKCIDEIIKQGIIGCITAVNALYSAQIFNIGTHLIDTVRMFVRKNISCVSGISYNLDKPDPDISGWFRFDGGVPFTMLATGKREDLIFEIDVVGEQGRIKSLENGNKVELYSFEESARYSGYRELRQMPAPAISQQDRLVQAVYDITAALKGERKDVACSGQDALTTLILSDALFKSAKAGGITVEIGADYAS